jgi:hypothetical protein
MLFSTPLVGCLNTGSCNRVRLSEAEKKWIEFYSEGDTLIFGNTKQIKEFVVTDKGSGFTACNKFELGPNEYENNGALLKSNTLEININFTKENQNNNEPDCHKNIYVSDLYSKNITNLGVLKQEPVYVPYLNKEIPTYLITSDTLTIDIDGGNQYVRSFNWSKKYGVVRYTRFNDEVFTLKKKK